MRLTTLALILLVAISSNASLLTLTNLNSFGQPDTSTVWSKQASTNQPALANGTVTTIGLPVPFYPSTNGVVQIYQAAGNYLLTGKTYGQGLLYRFPDSSSNATAYPLSGFNTFVTVSTTVNPVIVSGTNTTVTTLNGTNRVNVPNGTFVTPTTLQLSTWTFWGVLAGAASAWRLDQTGTGNISYVAAGTGGVGLFGVGTSSPDRALTVNGDIHATSDNYFISDNGTTNPAGFTGSYYGANVGFGYNKNPQFPVDTSTIGCSQRGHNLQEIDFDYYGVGIFYLSSSQQIYLKCGQDTSGHGAVQVSGVVQAEDDYYFLSDGWTPNSQGNYGSFFSSNVGFGTKNPVWSVDVLGNIGNSVNGSLNYINISDSSTNLDIYSDNNIVITPDVAGNYMDASTIIKSAALAYSFVVLTNGHTGTSNQFLKADGSLDTNAYATTTKLPTVTSSNLQVLKTTNGAGAINYQVNNTLQHTLFILSTNIVSTNNAVSPFCATIASNGNFVVTISIVDWGAVTSPFFYAYVTNSASAGTVLNNLTSVSGNGASPYNYFLSYNAQLPLSATAGSVQATPNGYYAIAYENLGGGNVYKINSAITLSVTNAPVTIFGTCVASTPTGNNTLYSGSTIKIDQY